MKDAIAEAIKEDSFKAMIRVTLANVDWLNKNLDGIKELFPQTLTHVSNLSLEKIGFGFKLLGLDWRTGHQLLWLIKFLEKTNVIQRDGYCIKRNADL